MDRLGERWRVAGDQHRRSCRARHDGRRHRRGLRAQRRSTSSRSRSTDAALERGEATLTGSIDRAVAKGKLSAGRPRRAARPGRFRGRPRRAARRRPGHRGGARAARRSSSGSSPSSTGSASPTRSWPPTPRRCRVTEISVATTRPNQVIGVHFFNPAPVMKLVEIVRTVVTAPEVVADVEALCARLGKVDVTINDRAGFIANALLFGYLNQAVSMLEARYATREDIDAAMRLGCGLPMGPLALMDLIGLDTAYEILDTMYRRGGRDRRHAPVPLIKQMVTAGLLGRKSGRGFYTYEKPGSPMVVPDELTADARRPRPPTRPRDRDGRRGRLRHDGHAASSRCSPRPGTRWSRVTRGAEKSAAVARPCETSLTKAVVRGKLTEAERDAARRPDHLVAPARPPRRRRPRGRGGGRGAVGQEGAVRRPRRDLQARRGARHDHLQPAGDRDRDGHPAPGRRGRPALLQPGAGAWRLVEIVSTIRTAPETTAATARAVVAGARQDRRCAAPTGPGSSSTRCCSRTSTTRSGCSRRRYATADDIDHAMKLGCGYPMGPFELLDVVGLDVALAIQRELYLELREPGFAPAPLLEHLVTAGYLGRKAGRGFRDHTHSGSAGADEVIVGTWAVSPRRNRPKSDDGRPSRRRRGAAARRRVASRATGTATGWCGWCRVVPARRSTAARAATRRSSREPHTSWSGRPTSAAT